MTRRAIGAAVLVLLMAAALLGISGCTSDTETACRPEIPAGRIQGFVRTGGLTVETVVTATRVPDAGLTLAVWEMKTYPGGYCTMDVPAGRYLLSVRLDEYSRIYGYSASGPVDGASAGDTLLVDDSTSPLLIDFHLSSFRLHMDLPASADSLPVVVGVYRRGAPPLPSWDTPRWGTTVREGKAEVNLVGVIPGSYKVEINLGHLDYACDCLWDGEHFWIPGVRDFAASPWIEAPADRAVDVTGQIDAEPARIEGEISGAWRELGLAPPALALITPDSVVVRGLRQVDSDGHFAASMYLPGPVKLLVEHEGVFRWIGGETFDAARIFVLENGHTITGVSLVESAVLVDFTSSDFRPNQPSLYLHDPAGLGIVAGIEYPMPAGEIYTIPNVRPGTFLLRIEQDRRGDMPWIPQWYDRASRPEDGQTILVGSEGSIVRVAVRLELGGRIEGHALDAGNGLKYLFYLTSANDPARWALGYGESDGRTFAFQGVPDGEWKVGASTAHPSEYPEQAPAGTVWYPGTTDWSAAGVIVIRNAGVVTGLEIVPPSR